LLSKGLDTLLYLNSIIDETFRLYTPISQSLSHTVPAGGTSNLCGYNLPPGTTVSTQAYTFHRDPASYPDPLRFNPDRWFNPTKEMKDAFFAWGTGSRGCMGHAHCLTGAHVRNVHVLPRVRRSCR
jgi:cytochrome P450